MKQSNQIFRMRRFSGTSNRQVSNTDDRNTKFYTSQEAYGIQAITKGNPCTIQDGEGQQE
jgi:hypothetical protein